MASPYERREQRSSVLLGLTDPQFMRTEDADYEAQAEHEERDGMTASVEPAVLETEAQGLAAHHAI